MATSGRKAGKTFTLQGEVERAIQLIDQIEARGDLNPNDPSYEKLHQLRQVSFLWYIIFCHILFHLFIPFVT